MWRAHVIGEVVRWPAASAVQPLEQMPEPARQEFRQAGSARMQALRGPDGFTMRLTARFAVGRKLG